MGVGAKAMDILWHFLVEAFVLGLVGGFFGLLIGVGGAQLIANLSEDLTPTVDWGAVAGGISISAVIGLLFGVYPATRAAKLNPIEALRYE
jgi:putative ABC transport system permease protein